MAQTKSRSANTTQPTLSYVNLTAAQKALYDLSRVEMTGCGPALLLPTDAQFHSAFPHLTLNTDDWVGVSGLLLRFARFQLVPRVGSGRVAVRATSSVGSTPVSEARIRELGGESLARVARLNRVNTGVHATNPGITAMRRKNALLALSRRGSPIKF